jgi:cell division protein FtsN
MAGITNEITKAEELREQIKALGYNATIHQRAPGYYTVKVIQTKDAQKAQKVQNEINKAFEKNIAFKIIN